MRIKLLTGIVTADYTSHKPGDVIDWDDAAEAGRFIATGCAVETDAPLTKADDRPAAPKALPAKRGK